MNNFFWIFRRKTHFLRITMWKFRHLYDNWIIWWSKNLQFFWQWTCIDLHWLHFVISKIPNSMKKNKNIYWICDKLLLYHYQVNEAKKQQISKGSSRTNKLWNECLCTVRAHIQKTNKTLQERERERKICRNEATHKKSNQTSYVTCNIHKKKVKSSHWMIQPGGYTYVAVHIVFSISYEQHSLTTKEKIGRGTYEQTKKNTFFFITLILSFSFDTFCETSSRCFVPNGGACSMEHIIHTWEFI